LRRPSVAAHNGGVTAVGDGDAFLDDVEHRLIELTSRVESRTLEGLLFARLCEDRGILPSDTLRCAADARRVGEAVDRMLRGLDELFHGWLLGRGAAPRATALPNDTTLRDWTRYFCAAPLRNLGADILGRTYERSLERRDRGARKSGGVYYTPDHVVRYMVESTIGALLEAREPNDEVLRVLDPACGSGSFLLGAFDCLLARHRGNAVQILLDGVFGVDLDERAVDITKLSLALRALEHEGVRHEAESATSALARLEANVRRGDSLVDTSFDYAKSFPEVFARGGFDAVVGNPPYVSYGGRQAVDIPAELREYFARRYESGGWSSAHSLFIERSAKDLSRRLVSFIVPDQVGHLAGYRSLRELLAREGNVAEVRYWGENVFKGVVTPALTFVFDKSSRGGTTRITNADGSEHRVQIDGGDPWTASSAKTLVDKLRRGSTSIRRFLADCGVRTTDAKKQVTRLDAARGKFVPVLEGRQIGRYSCSPPEVAVRLDADRHLFVSRDEKYERAAFLIRQTAAYPIVGPREHATYFRNSLHALYAPDNGWDVRYVVALLNSKLLRFAYVATVREAHQRAFPQVKLAPLGALPIKDPKLDVREGRAQHDRLVAMVSEMLDLKHELRKTVDPTAANAPHTRTAQLDARTAALHARIATLDARIDDEVFRLYQLTDGEIATVEAAVAALAPPP
jgi:hypothetical protein